MARVLKYKAIVDAFKIAKMTLLYILSFFFGYKFICKWRGGKTWFIFFEKRDIQYIQFQWNLKSAQIRIWFLCDISCHLNTAVTFKFASIVVLWFLYKTLKKKFTTLKANEFGGLSEWLIFFEPWSYQLHIEYQNIQYLTFVFLIIKPNSFLY